MKVQLLKHDTDDYFVLENRDQRDLAMIEGPAQEWRSLALALRGKWHCSFKRCAVSDPEHGNVALFSPKNRTSKEDAIFVAAEKADLLAEHIEKVLAAYEMEGL